MEDRRWFKRTIWLIAALGTLRLFYAAIVPLDLVHDEAYYWEWSRQLDWGYYSKPPMIAWLIGLSTRLGGSSPLFVRLPAIVLGSLGLIWIYLLAARFYGRRAGFWAVCLAAATPANAALSLLMTIDAPLMFCWAAALYSFWRLWEPGPHRGWWWVAATACVGLGLLSKQTMLAFLVLGGLFLLLGREDRRQLGRPAFWLWAIGALLFLAPVMWWNSQNDWITAQHTSEHFQSGSVTLLRRVIRSAEFWATQVGVMSPITGVLVVAILVAGLRRFWPLGRKERYLLCFSGVPLMGVVVLSFMQRVEPNWAAVFYPSAVVLLAGVVVGRVELPCWPAIHEVAARRAVVVGVLSVVLTYVVAFGCGIQGTKLDPAVRLRGWKQLGESIAQRGDSFPRPGQTFVVVTAGRAPASELAFYMPQQPRVYLWSPAPGVSSQYDLWGGPEDKSGWDALIVTPAQGKVPPDLASAFDFVENRGLVNVEVGAGRQHSFRVWRGAVLDQWPGKSPHIARARASTTVAR
jgi:undecaprenyl-diphosphatase